MAEKRNILSSYRNRIIITFSIILAIALIFGSIRSYTLLRKNASEKAFALLQKEMLDNTYELKSIVNNNANLVKNVSLILGNYDAIVKDNRRIFFSNTLLRLIEDDFQIYSIWAVFKPYTIDDLDEFYGKPFEAITGQFNINFNRESKRIKQKKEEPADYALLEKYLPMFNSSQQVIVLGPVKDPYWQLAGESYIVRIVAPIVNLNNIVGVVGIDIHLNTLIQVVKRSKFDLYLLDDDLFTLYSNDNNAVIGKNLKETYPYILSKSEFMKKITIHESYSDNEALFHPQKPIYFSTHPIYFSIAKQYWSVVFYQDEKHILSSVRKDILKIFLSPLIVFILLMLTISIIANNLNSFFNDVLKLTNLLSKGKVISKSKKQRKNDEMREITNSLFNISEFLKENKNLAFSIVNEENIDETSLNYKKNDFNKTLLKINEKLQEERNIRIEQGKKQELTNLVSKAVADINDIQREYVDDITELSYQSIKYITHFVNAVQGGFYTFINIEGETSYLELTAFYSYNRRIYTKKKIEIGDGLAGTCAEEMLPIYSKVPPNYLEITSGLGKTPPKYIYLLPLVIHDTLFGVIEVAFLEKLQDYHIQFLQSISEIIASTISTSEINSRTRRLLEQTQKITEEMKQKESEMNEQIKELEDLKNKSDLMELDRSAVIETINKLTFYAEFDTTANVLTINNNLSEKIQIQAVDAMMMTYYDILFISDVETHNQYWEDLLKGKTIEFEHNVSLGKFNFWLNCIMAPVYDGKENIYKIIFFALDHTEIKEKEQEMKKMFVDINNKAEQIAVQESQMDEFFIEFENTTEEIESLKKQLKILKEEKENSEKSLAFMQKEFQKRTNKTKRLQLNLKTKVKSLEEEIKLLKGEN